MIDRIKQTVKHTAFYALGNLAPKLSGFVLLPIYTKLISLSDYGILGGFEIIEMLAVHTLAFGSPQAILRWQTLTTDDLKKKKHIFTMFVFLLCTCLVCLAIILPLRQKLAELFFDQTVFGSSFIYLFAAITFTVLSRVPLTLMRSENKSHLYAMCIGIQFAVNLLANIWFVAILRLGIQGVFMSQAVSSGILFLGLVPYLGKRMAPYLELAELKAMLLFSFPFVLSALSSTTLNMGDRYLLMQLSSFQEVGLYTLGYKFSNMIKIFLVDAFALALPTVGWAIIKGGKEPQRFLAKALTYLVFFLLWFALFISAFSKGIIHTFALDKSYWDAYLVIPPLSLRIVFLGMQTLFFFELQIAKKTRLIPVIVGSAAVLNIIANLILIPNFGMLGAAYGTVLAQLASVIFAHRMVQKAYPVDHELKRILTLFSVAVILFLGTSPFDQFPMLGRILLKGLIVLSFPAVLYLIRFYDAVELDRIAGSIRKWKGKLSGH